MRRLPTAGGTADVGLPEPPARLLPPYQANSIILNRQLTATANFEAIWCRGRLTRRPSDGVVMEWQRAGWLLLQKNRSCL